jgi:hypothetical protein
MIRSAEINNYRCFDRVKLANCRRINAIVGKNASGKTALLEALFLATGSSPELATRFRGWRGYEGTLTGTFEQIDEAFWTDLFYRYDVSRKINIQVRGTGRYNRAVSIRFLKERDAFVGVTADTPPQSGALSSVEFTWARGDKSSGPIRPRFIGNGYRVPQPDQSSPPTAFFAYGHIPNNAESVRRFSALSTSRLEEPIIKAMAKEFPFIKSMDIQAHAGVSMIHADIPWLPKKVPVSAISSGVHKLLVLLLAIAEHKRNAIFIDEIENNFHYSLFDSLWRLLIDVCAKQETQLFVSTHSKECLEALAAALSAAKRQDDASLIRSTLDDDGNVAIEQFVGLEAARYGEVR